MRIRRKTKRRFKRLLMMTPVMTVAWLLYIIVRSPSSAAPSRIPVGRNPDTIAHGRYLFIAIAACDRCHSARDFTRKNAPLLPGGRGVGRIIDERGLPGEIVAPNLTPDKETGLGGWTDGEKIRAIREGIGKDGRALYPLMPYTYYRRMTDEDVHAIVAYLNSLPAVRNPLPKSTVNFWTRAFMKGEPQPVISTIPPIDPGGGEIYGEYLGTIAACEECHTPVSRGSIFSSSKDESRLFAGGRFFSTPYGQVYSANITSDPATGVGAWPYLQFAARLRNHRTWSQSEPPRVGGDKFTVMPWESYAQITDQDLEALFLYVKAIRPIVNRVEAHPGVPNSQRDYYMPNGSLELFVTPPSAPAPSPVPMPKVQPGPTATVPMPKPDQNLPKPRPAPFTPQPAPPKLPPAPPRTSRLSRITSDAASNPPSSQPSSQPSGQQPAMPKPEQNLPTPVPVPAVPQPAPPKLPRAPERSSRLSRISAEPKLPPNKELDRAKDGK